MAKFDFADYWAFRGRVKSEITQLRRAVSETQESSGNIPDGAVTTDKIFSRAVTTEKIADGAVTTPKIFSRAVTSEKIALQAVTAEHIAPQSITEEHLSQELLDKINDDAGYVWAFAEAQQQAVEEEKTTTNIYRR